MARKKSRHPDSAAQTLDAIESWGDRAAGWISDNPTPILAVVVVVLVVAGVVGLTRESFDAGAEESATALARVQHDYRVAMGGTPGSIEIPEPANPDTARRIRREAIADYEAVAAEYAGTSAGALALLEAGKLQQQLDDNAGALASFTRGLESVDDDDTIGAFLLARIASVHEVEGRYAEAADAYERAASVPGYALRYDALADAARCHALAGDADRALAIGERLRAEAPDVQIPPYLEARLAELRRTAGGPSSD